MGSKTPKSDKEAMSQRRSDTGLPYSKVAKEHGVSKSTAFRAAKPRESDTAKMFRNGFTKMDKGK
jgi:transposase-like protein